MNTKIVTAFSLAILVVALSLIGSIQVNGTQILDESIRIHSDGSITPSSAPMIRNGDTYVVNDSVIMYCSCFDGIVVERDNIVLDGAGHKLLVPRGGQTDGIHLEGRVNVTVKNFLLEAFYYGVAFWNCSRCTISENNLTGSMYCIYLQNSSNNKFYHNNIYPGIYCQNSSNVWDDGYPSGGNYWTGYPYTDVKSGPNQNLPGSDGIGDTPVDLSIFVQETNDTDRYPLMSPHAMVPEFSPLLMIPLFILATVFAGISYRRKHTELEYPHRPINTEYAPLEHA
jgi:parallel beta-helix repeat protein